MLRPQPAVHRGQGDAGDTTSATPAVDIGGTIRDTATVIDIPRGRMPGGSVSFSVFGPDDATCAGPPVFTDNRSLHFPRTLVVTSAPFTPTAPGTYRWVATYNGDAHYQSVTAPCNAPNETSVVNDPPTRITTSATPSVALGEPISDTATVTAVKGPAPTGTVTFTLFRQVAGQLPTCTGPPVFTSANRPLSGAPPTATSAPFIPQAAGTYRWVATYNGDANYPPQTSACDAPDETSVVKKVIPTITTSATPTGVQGQPISDAATVTGPPNGPSPTGTVEFRLWDPESPLCAGPVIAQPEPLSSGAPPTATATATLIPTEPGTHRWVAVYWGDDNYERISGNCNDPNETTEVSLAQSPIAVFRPSNGFWFVESGPTVHWGGPGDIAVPADYNGDGPDDVAVFRPANGVWLVQNGPTVPFGTSGDVPVPADYDGDRDDDIAVFRPSTGQWFVRDGLVTQFGIEGDIPVPADYNGDGDDEIAVYRPSLGVWFVQNGGVDKVWGTAGDIPVPGDYSGDVDDDRAVYRPSLGVWLVENGPTVAWGTDGDIPVSADYDGDGDDEFAVFRPSLGVWFVQGGATVAWGTSDDDPLPLPAAVRERFFG